MFLSQKFIDCRTFFYLFILFHTLCPYGRAAPYDDSGCPSIYEEFRSFPNIPERRNHPWIRVLFTPLGALNAAGIATNIYLIHKFFGPPLTLVNLETHVVVPIDEVDFDLHELSQEQRQRYDSFIPWVTAQVSKAKLSGELHRRVRVALYRLVARLLFAGSWDNRIEIVVLRRLRYYVNNQSAIPPLR